MENDTEIGSDEVKSVTMCCGGKKCPILSKDKEWITIADDFGNVIKIPRKDQSAFVVALGELFDL